MTTPDKPSARSCIRCGRCLAECPVYDVVRRESVSPRGKMTLLTARGISLDDSRLARILSQCLQCGRCATVCTAEVPAHGEVKRARGRLSDRLGLPWPKKFFLEHVLGRPTTQRRLWKAARPWSRRLPADSGLGLRIPGLDTRLPLPRGAAYLDGQTKVIDGPAGAPRVAMFVGCLYGHLWPGAAFAAEKLLGPLAEMTVPGDQACCGLAAATAGDRATARRLAVRNIEALSEAEPDVVLTLCASCSHQLRSGMPALVEDDAELFEKAGALAERIMDAAAFVARHSHGQPAPLPGCMRVGFHRPCHLPEDQARDVAGLLASVPGLDLEAWGDHCCGHGGLFRLSQPRLSRQIRGRRLAEVATGGLGAVATNCSGCAWQLWEYFGPMGIEVRHPLEFLTGGGHK